MCGIAGKIDLTRPVQPELIARMCEVLRHRGPDARGIHLTGGVGLAVQRLAVIDLNTGDQPIYSEDGAIVVVLNGEIYNYLELRKALQARGHRFRTQSDTETVVHLYEELGPKCVEQLRGMFAFALWDERRGKLLLARDRVGKKPLFFRADSDRLWFASEPSAIFQDPSVPREANPDAIDAYMRFQYVPHPLSAFKDVHKLPPAHVLEWDSGAPALSRYWSVDYRQEEQLSLEEAAVSVRDSLLEATDLRLRADVPVGAFLSGGLDSSAVVAAMAHAGAAHIKTFSVGFTERSHDESRFARQVADRYATDHHELVVKPDVIASLPRIVWHHGEPFGDSSALPTFALAEFSRREVTVALNGDGGDENFGGYDRYRAQVLGERLGLAAPPVRRATAALAAALLPRVPPRTIVARGLRVLSAAALSPAQRYDNHVASFDRDGLERLYTPDYARELSGGPTRDRMILDAWLASKAPSCIERVLDVDVQTYLPCDLLTKMDIATMAHSLEARSPFLDHVLMERVARLPGGLKLSGLKTKVLLKEAMRPWLPAAVIDRPKMGFGVPIAKWLRGPLAHVPEEILLDPLARARGIFQVARVRELIEAHRSGARDTSRELWGLMVLELWFQTYVDGAEPRMVEFDPLRSAIGSTISG